MKLAELVAALPRVESRGDGNPDITLVTSDSRQVIPGALFVAYPGVAVDGHRFIDDAVRRGASAVVGQVAFDRVGSLTYLQVPDARQALASLSACWYGFPARKLVMIGVTGTDGKTTTVNLVHSILTAAGLNAGMISTVNAVIGGQSYDTGLHTTTPDAPDVQKYLAQMVGAGQTHCVLEATSHGLAQHRVDACEFDVGVITNITHEHLDLHGSFEAYRAAKARLFEMVAQTSPKEGVTKTAVLNADDPAYEFLRQIRTDAELSYGMATCALVSTLEVAYKPDSMRFVAVTPKGRIPLQTKLVGQHNVLNILAAVSVGLALRLPIEAIQRGVAALQSVPGRWERIDEGQSFVVIVDFAHTPHALEKVLQTTRRMTAGQVIVVFGSAGLRDVEKRGLMGHVAGRLADKIIITAEDPRTESLDDIMAAIAGGLVAEGKHEDQDFWRIGDRAEAIRFAVELARPGDLVIACGKGHEQSMCFGTTEYPWDDRQAVRDALQRMRE